MTDSTHPVQRTPVIFKAWVPCASGRLSFLKIGDTTYPNPCLKTVEYNPTATLGRAYCSQMRYTGDAEIPKWMVKWFFPVFGALSFYLNEASNRTSSSPLKNMLRGAANFFEALNSIKDEFFSFHLAGEWRNETLEGIVAIERRFSAHKMISIKRDRNAAHEEWRQNSDKNIPIRLKHDAYCETLKKSLSFCNFSLQRNGILEIRLPKLIEDQDKNSHPLRATTSLAGEMYFFIKEITHTHKHHDQESDRVIDVYHIDNSTPDSKLWLDRVRANLLRHLVDLQRLSPRNINLQRAIGMIAYCESFDRISQEIDETRVKLPSIVNFDLLKNSISSKLSELSIHRQGREFRILSIIALTTLIATTIPITVNESTRALLSPTSICSGTVFIEYFEYISALMFFGAFAWVSDWFRIKILRTAWRKTASTAYRVFASLPRRVQYATWFIVGVLFAMLSVWTYNGNSIGNPKALLIPENYIPNIALKFQECRRIKSQHL